MATRTIFLYAFPLFLSLSLFANAQSTSPSYLPNLRSRASSTTSALDCSQTATGNVSACYPTFNLIPACCQPCLVNVTLLQPCASTDFRCLCAHASEIQIQTLSCINGTCSTQDEQTAVNYYYSYCDSMNYPLSAVPSSSTPSPTASLIVTKTTTATPTPTASPSSSQSLATAAAAGIGVSLAALFVVAALTIFFLHRRRRRKASVGNRLADEVGTGDPRGLDRRDTAPPSYPTVQEIDGKTVTNIALQERPPDAAVTRDLSDSSNASTMHEIPVPSVIHEMDARRPWSWGRSRGSSQAG